VAVGGVGSEALAGTSAPLQRAAASFRLPGVGQAVAAGATVAMLGVLLSQLLGISRMLYAMARRGDLPAAMGHVDARFGVPDRAIVLTGLVAITVALFGTLESIVAAASFAILFYYGVANLAAWRMPREDKLYPDGVPLLGLVSCILLATTLPLRTIVSGLILLAVGALWRWLWRRRTPPNQQ